MKKIARMTKGNVVVKRNTIFFPTPEDPDGLKHVAQKFLEAEAGVNLLVTAIALSGLSINSLDLPGASAMLKAHAEKNELPSYPGPSVVAALVDSIRGAQETWKRRRQRNRPRPSHPRRAFGWCAPPRRWNREAQRARPRAVPASTKAISTIPGSNLSAPQQRARGTISVDPRGKLD